MKQYLNLLEDILKKGEWKEPARENMPKTLSLFGTKMEFDMKEGFPLLTTKKMYHKAIITELLWFLKGDTNIKYLVDNGCNIWNDDYKRWSNEVNILVDGDLGNIYGHTWRNYGGKSYRKSFQPKPILNIKFDLLEVNENSKKSKYLGKIFDTQNNGKLKVINFNKSGYVVQFLNTGSVVDKVSSSQIKNENGISDPYRPTYRNIACIGKDNGELDSFFRKKLRNTWENIIGRCYDKDRKGYISYGGRGVFVNNRWLCFEYFVSDVINLDGWENKINNWSEYQLDKDIAGDGFEYNRDKCLWVTKDENIKHQAHQYKYKLENIDTGEVVEVTNILRFEKNRGIKNFNNSFNKLVSGEIHQNKRWKLVEKIDLHKGVDQIKHIVDGLKSNPMSRYHILDAWDLRNFNESALMPCHLLYQFNCREIHESELQNILWLKHGLDLRKSQVREYAVKNGVPLYRLDLQMYQRSCDMFLGVPFNIASASLLLHLVAKAVNMVPGKFIWIGGDTHIYENHMDQVLEQIKREPMSLPVVTINKEISSLRDIENLSPKDVIISTYKSHPSIKGELKTGL